MVRRAKKGDVVMAKLGKNLPWRKVRVVRRSGKMVTITGPWGQGVTGTINERFIKGAGILNKK